MSQTVPAGLLWIYSLLSGGQIPNITNPSLPADSGSVTMVDAAQRKPQRLRFTCAKKKKPQRTTHIASSKATHNWVKRSWMRAEAADRTCWYSIGALSNTNLPHSCSTYREDTITKRRRMKLRRRSFFLIALCWPGLSSLGQRARVEQQRDDHNKERIKNLTSGGFGT